MFDQKIIVEINELSFLCERTLKGLLMHQLTKVRLASVVTNASVNDIQDFEVLLTIFDLGYQPLLGQLMVQVSGFPPIQVDQKPLDNQKKTVVRVKRNFSTFDNRFQT